MTFSFRRTVASELTLWLSMITTLIVVCIGVSYYFYAASSVSHALTAEAERTADEFSELLVLPLFNLDRPAAERAAKIYLNSERISGIRIEVEGIGEIFNNLSSVSSSLPLIERTVSRDELLLGSMELLFNDSPIRAVRKRAVWTTLLSVVTIVLIYLVALRFILRRILVGPLSRLGGWLQEIADGSFDGQLAPVAQEDLNSIVSAANRMSAEIVARTDELAEHERNYREIYNATSDAIIIRDAGDGSILDVNQAMLDMYGYSRQEVMNLQIAELSKGVPPYGEEEAKANVQMAIEEGPQVFKWQARRKDGSLFWVEVVLKKTFLSGQEVLLALVRDISDRLRLEGRLRQSQKMEAIGTLAGGIAHDFNNILTSILGYTELAQLKSDKNSEVFGYLEQVDQASKRARDLVKQILTFSRKQQPEKMVLQLAPVIHEAVSLLRSSIPTSVEITEDLVSQARVEVDPGQMHQVVMNLCTNGYQAMADKPGTLAVSLKDVHIDAGDRLGNVGLEPGSYVVLEVHDEGAGMSEEMKNKIFEPYYTTKGAEKGTGLGLAVVHGIITSHQGSISVYSEPGQGTCFQIYLPTSDGEVVVEAAGAGRVDAGGGKRVMVVDDEGAVRDLMQELLVHGGYRVDTFVDGSAAWNALSAEPGVWDLLITDLTMPEMGGVELAEKVAGIRSDLPVILCTGYGEMISARHGERGAAISACLQKPVTMQELFSTVGRVLHGEERGEDHPLKEEL